MTRKRYKKLIMAAGASRNEAEFWALDAWLRGIPYQQMYDTKLHEFFNDERINPVYAIFNAMNGSLGTV